MLGDAARADVIAALRMGPRGRTLRTRLHVRTRTPRQSRTPPLGKFRVNEGVPMRAILADFKKQGLERHLPKQ